MKRVKPAKNWPICHGPLAAQSGQPACLTARRGPLAGTARRAQFAPGGPLQWCCLGPPAWGKFGELLAGNLVVQTYIFLVQLPLNNYH